MTRGFEVGSGRRGDQRGRWELVKGPECQIEARAFTPENKGDREGLEAGREVIRLELREDPTRLQVEGRLGRREVRGKEADENDVSGSRGESMRPKKGWTPSLIPRGLTWRLGSFSPAILLAKIGLSLSIDSWGLLAEVDFRAGFRGHVDNEELPVGRGASKGPPRTRLELLTS